MKSLQKLQDDELVAMYADGNNEAFDTLLLRHKDRLFSYINFIVRDNEVAEDIFQETFVRVIISIQQRKYSKSGKFYSWLTCIAHNLLIDHFRIKNNNHVLVSDEQFIDYLELYSPTDTNIEESIITTQVLEDVQQLVTFLPEEQKQVVLMRFYQDLSFKEIAEQTGVSINTALGRMRYAILNMRKMMKDHAVYLV